MAKYAIVIIVGEHGELAWQHDLKAERNLNDDQKWVVEAMHNAYHSVQQSWETWEEVKQNSRPHKAVTRKIG